jgi:hypothetical protein
MDELFVDIDSDVADFSEEINFRLQSTGIEPDDTWMENQFNDPLFILNAKPYEKMWYNLQNQSFLQKIVGRTKCNLQATKKWLEMWEIPIDKVERL